MKLSLKILGLIAMLASPFWWIETHLYNEVNHNTSLTGVCDLIYMIGWLCSIWGLKKLDATSDTRAGKSILSIQILLLCTANIWNIWVIIDPFNNSLLFRILDMFWPLSNLFMLITGVMVLIKKRLVGFDRFAPLIAGLWLPVTAILAGLLNDLEVSSFIVGAYSFCAFFILGLVIFKQKELK